jgi:hypothetical protein
MVLLVSSLSKRIFSCSRYYRFSLRPTKAVLITYINAALLYFFKKIVLLFEQKALLSVYVSYIVYVNIFTFLKAF